ncbi:MAG: TonB-dependent receptor [Saprospiraceae bacterium]|nr:TonB-dependent receptor [Saprospiraceae bacterium]
MIFINTLRISLAAVCCLFGIYVFSQANIIKGNVMLQGTGEPLSGILISVQGKGVVTVTDGRFVLELPQPGNHLVVASCVGFVTVQQSVEARFDQTVEVLFEMEEAVLNLPAAVVESVSLTGGMRGLRNLPGSATYLSPKELQRFSYTDINRTLRAVPGINFREEDGYGLRPNIGLRGAGGERSSKITVMEDGVLAAPAPYAAPAAYYFPTIGRMSALEVLKGSSQVRFGPFTTGGAINLISTPIPTEFSGRLNLLGGSFGNRNVHASVGDSQRNFGYLVETFQYKSAGFKDLDGGGETGFDKKDYLLKFQLNTGPKAKVYQSLGFKVGQSSEVSDETYLGLTQADFDQNPYRRYAASQKDRMDWEHQQYSVRHIVQFSKNLDLTTTAYRQDFERTWYRLDKVKESTGQSPAIGALLNDPAAYPEAFATINGASSPEGGLLYVKSNNRSYRSEGVQSVLNWRFHTKSIRHNLDLGLRLHTDEMDRFQWTDEYTMSSGTMLMSNLGQPGTESNRIEGAEALAAHAQLKTQWGNWTLIPGLRHERIQLKREEYGKADPERLGTELVVTETEVDIFIPGIGVDYKFSKDLNVFAGVHKGFSPPGIKEGSQPEESINYELGSRYRNGRLSGTAVLFYNDYKNLLGSDLAAGGGTGSTDQFNGGAAVSQGLEFQLTWDAIGASAKGWSLPLSVVYTFTDASFHSNFKSEFEGWGDVADGDGLPYLAPHQLAIMGSLTHKKFDFNLSGKYQSDLRTVAGQGEIATAEKVPGYFILDASASYQLHPKAAVFGSITNLLDNEAVVSRHPAGLRPAMPRALMVGLRVNF